MQVKFLCDSFDIAKQSLLRGLAPCGVWSAQPKFSAEPTAEQADVYSRLVGVPLISREVLSKDSDRAAYFAAVCACATHLFLDPDTGLSLRRAGRKGQAKYLYREELGAIAARERALTLVFDQSIPRGHERACLDEKLSALAAEGLSAVAQRSHACFILVGQQRELVQQALDVLLHQSRPPYRRFVDVMCPKASVE